MTSPWEQGHACALALLGLERPLAGGLRMVFDPTFHETFCIEIRAGQLILHRLPREVANLAFWDGGRSLSPLPEELPAFEHPIYAAPLSEGGEDRLLALAAALPEKDAVVPPGSWRDGMTVACEVIRGGVPRTYGVDYPVGCGPEKHTVLVRGVLTAALEALPEAREHLEALCRYVSPAPQPTSLARKRGKQK